MPRPTAGLLWLKGRPELPRGLNPTAEETGVSAIWFPKGLLSPSHCVHGYVTGEMLNDMENLGLKGSLRDVILLFQPSHYMNTS